MNQLFMFGVMVLALATNALAGSNGQAKILTLESRISIPSPSLNAAWSASGRQIFINQRGYGTLRVVDLDKGELLVSPSSKHNAMEDVAASPDGKFVAWSRPSQVRLLEATTLKDVTQLERQLEDCTFQIKSSMQLTLPLNGYPK